MDRNTLFIAATGQNVGKTTLCLGILAALRERFPDAGFLKPVGQRHLEVEEGVSVDKDVALFKKHFNLKSGWKEMSPLIVPAGFTKEYLDGKNDSEKLLETIKASYRKISENSSFTLVEGTGHVGVGSLFNLNNAQIAAALNLEMVIIASGGLGSSIDELALNLAMCREHGVKVRGVILNKVLQEKQEMIARYYPRALEKYEVPLIGTLPFLPYLSEPTFKDFETLFKTELLAGEKHRYRHFKSVRLVAVSAEAYRSEIVENELVITPACREDIVEATLERHSEGGLILTGRRPPSGAIKRRIAESDLPTLYAPLYSYDAMSRIISFIAKIRLGDKIKIQKAIALVQQHLPIDNLLNT